jgi:hypothetical protein
VNSPQANPKAEWVRAGFDSLSDTARNSHVDFGLTPRTISRASSLIPPTAHTYP